MGFAEPVSESWISEHYDVAAHKACIVSQFENEPSEPV